MIYFITGAEEREFEINRIIDKIRKENQGIKEKYFDAGQNEEDKFFESLNYVSMFGGREMLVLKRGENIKKIDKLIEEIRKFDTSSKEIVIDYLDEKLEITKKIEKSDKIEIIEVKKQNKHEALKEMVKKELDISEHEALEFIEMVGTDIHRTRNEASKVKAFLGGESYDIDKIRGILSVSKEYNIFEMGEELLDGNKRKVLEYLKKEKAYMLFLSNLSRDMRVYLKMKLLKDERKLDTSSNNYNVFMKNSYPSIKPYFSEHAYVIFKKLGRVSKLSTVFLKEKIKEALEIERKIKSGEIDEDMGLELFVMKF